MAAVMAAVAVVVVAAAANRFAQAGCSMPHTIALTSGEDRFATLSAALQALGSAFDLRDRQRVIIKPNLVSTERQSASTHPEALRAVLAAVRERYHGPLAITEGSALRHTSEGFARFGYQALARQYQAELVDLNNDDTVAVMVYDRWLRPRTLRLARRVVESDYRISLSLPKTHDTVIVTLSLKNIIMGALVNRTIAHHKPAAAGTIASLLRRGLRKAGSYLPLPTWVEERFGLRHSSDKQAMHQGFATINLNLALLAPLVQPQLAVLDGHVAMQGAGPINGEALPWGIAIAGCNGLAVDRFAARLMGIDPERVGYLAYATRMGLSSGDPDAITLVGNVAAATVQRSFRMHPTAAQQGRWQRTAATRLVAAASQKLY
jgi:uncharacterized protein (DUF362 family)